MKRLISLYLILSSCFVFHLQGTAQITTDQDEIIWTEEGTNYIDDPQSEKTNIVNEDSTDSNEVISDSNEIIDENDTIIFDNNDTETVYGNDSISVPETPITSKNEDEEVKEEDKKRVSGLLRFLETNSKVDSLSILFKKLSASDYIPFGDNVTFRDTIIVNPIFMPFVFDGQVLYDDYKLYTPEKYKKDSLSFFQAKTDSVFIMNEFNKKLYRDLQNYIALEHPTIIKYSEENLPTDIPKREELQSSGSFAELIKVDNTSAPDEIAGPYKYVPKIKKFQFNAENSLQLAQNYISPNWYAGGNSNLNLVAVNTFKFNYNNLRNFKVENTLESRLTLNNAPTDTLRSIQIGQDVFRFNTTIGIKAATKWYYTLTGTFETQLFKNYQPNTNTLNAAFLAPFSLNAGLGMQYSTEKQFKNNKYKKIVFTANIAPISTNYKYTRIKDIAARNGIPEDKRAIIDVGSTINAGLTFNFSRFISWTSKFQFFTNYKSIKDSYWENTFDFMLNRYLSTRIYVNVRYDDTVEKKEDFNSYFQINELLSFGLNYKW